MASIKSEKTEVHTLEYIARVPEATPEKTFHCKLLLTQAIFFFTNVKIQNDALSTSLK